MAPSSYRSLALIFAASVSSLGLARPCLAAEDSSDTEEPTESAKGDDDAKAKKGDAEAPSKPKETAGDDAYGHMGQFGLRAGLVLGYRIVLRYGDDSPYCSAPKPEKPVADQQKFCGYGAPLATDLGLSFGVLDFIEPFVWARFGLAADTHTDTNPLKLVGAGVRLYTMSDAAFKIFIEPAVGLELEGGRGSAAWTTNDPKYSKDFVFHVAAGPQLDFHKNFGAYVTGGISMAVVRSLAASLELNIGVQGRLP
ncbi:MAG TPA: hypothetical protein VGQ57_20640 [Polyangiaceae bacterium]|nr:hypothetical protein [Polyangiaceae bacterium]